jgi:hypothetical protein
MEARNLKNQTRLFFATMGIRNHTARHEQTVAEFIKTKSTDYAGLLDELGSWSVEDLHTAKFYLESLAR